MRKISTSFVRTEMHPSGSSFSLVLAKRFARKRAPIQTPNETPFTNEKHFDDNDEEEINMEAFSNNKNFFPSSFQESGTATAPSDRFPSEEQRLPKKGSLDRIREEIALLQMQKQKELKQKMALQKRMEMEKAAAEQEGSRDVSSSSSSRRYPPSVKDPRNEGKEGDALYSMVLESLRAQHSPHSVYYSGKEVQEGLALLNERERELVAHESEDVLRKGSKKDLARYLKLVFPHLFHPNANAMGVSSSSSSIAVMQTAEELMKEFETEKNTLLASIQMEEENKNHDQNPYIKELAWINVLQRKTDEEIKLLLHFHLLERDDIEALLESPTDHNNKEDRSKEVESKHKEEEEEEGEGTASHSFDGLEEKLQLLTQLQYNAELVQDITQLHLQKTALPIELYNVMHRVKKEKAFFSISEKELKLLEDYEERTVDIPLPNTSSSSLNEKGNLNDTVRVNPKLIDMAISPSNRLLYALSKKDEKIRQGFEGLEKIKRNSFLDPAFQEALKVSHVLEEESVAPHLRGVSPRDKKASMEKEEEEETSSSRFRARRKEGGGDRTGPTPHPIRPFSSVDVPYFYASSHNVIAPQGHYNLPREPLPTHPKYNRNRPKRRKNLKGASRFSSVPQ